MAVLGHGYLYGELIAAGISFPEDMGLVAFDRVTEVPEVTAIVQPHFESGRRGLRHLVNAVENGVFGIPQNPCRLSVQCQWHEGETLPNRA